MIYKVLMIECWNPHHGRWESVKICIDIVITPVGEISFAASSIDVVVFVASVAVTVRGGIYSR